jgi:hypothetical protein
MPLGLDRLRIALGSEMAAITRRHEPFEIQSARTSTKRLDERICSPTVRCLPKESC